MQEQELHRFTVEIDKNMHTNLKILSAGFNKSMKDIVQEAIKKEIKSLQKAFMKEEVYDKS